MYVTYMKEKSYKQSVLDFEALYNDYGPTQLFEKIPNKNITVDINNEQSLKLYEKYDFDKYIPMLQNLANMGETIPNDYHKFFIPKSSGGLREINAPNPILKNHLSTIKDIFEKQFLCLAHNVAYAYVPNRCTLDAVKLHQENESKWFIKLDIKNFFPNCNKEFILNQLQQVFPFGIIDSKYPGLLDRLITPGILNNQLPQGTPLSPFLTNMIMLPIDCKILKLLYSYNQYFVYTRYADDIIISSKYDFDWRKLQQDISNILKEDTPFDIKKEKTRYGSSAGRNWNLGLMLNKDNNITIGYRKKETFRAMLFNFLNDYKNGVKWSVKEIQELRGLLSYYREIEPDYFNKLIEKYNRKFNIDFYTITKI